MNTLARIVTLASTGPLSSRTWDLIERAIAAEDEARETRDHNQREFALTLPRRVEMRRFMERTAA
jgi:hypothetical protein